MEALASIYDAILGLPSVKQQHQGTKLRFAKTVSILIDNDPVKWNWRKALIL
jgi:hypothetical protein